MNQRATAGPLVELGELAVGGGRADSQALGLAEPAFAFSFGDAGEQVVPDLFQASSLLWVRP